MYSVIWVDHNRSLNCMVGEIQSMKSMVNILENSKIKFKVSDPVIGMLSQEDFGMGDFEYWLHKDRSISQSMF